MKIVAHNYTYGGISLEVIGETPVEVALLKNIWSHGSMARGYGRSETERGSVTGFFLEPTNRQEPTDAAD